MKEWIMPNVKWYYILAIALGLGAIVAIVYIVVRSDGILERINNRKSAQIEGSEE
jgi:hypothetical protein